MQLLYESDNFTLILFNLQPTTPLVSTTQTPIGGYELVDKFARKEIFIEGALAKTFQNEVNALIQTSPTVEEIDDYLARFSPLMQHPFVLH